MSYTWPDAWRPGRTLKGAAHELGSCNTECYTPVAMGAGLAPPRRAVSSTPAPSSLMWTPGILAESLREEGGREYMVVSLLLFLCSWTLL